MVKYLCKTLPGLVNKKSKSLDTGLHLVLFIQLYYPAQSNNGNLSESKRYCELKTCKGNIQRWDFGDQTKCLCPTVIHRRVESAKLTLLDHRKTFLDEWITLMYTYRDELKRVLLKKCGVKLEAHLLHQTFTINLDQRILRRDNEKLSIGKIASLARSMICLPFKLFQHTESRQQPTPQAYR